MRAAVCADTVTMAFGRPNVASITGPRRFMKAPASPGSRAIIGEPCETKIEGKGVVSMPHWITAGSDADSTPLHATFTTQVTSAPMTTPSLTQPAPLDATAQPARSPSAWQLGWRQLLRDDRQLPEHGPRS